MADNTNDSLTRTLRRQAQAAYVAYGDSVGWVNHQGDPMPHFQDLAGPTQRAWIDAAEVSFNAGYRLAYADATAGLSPRV